MPKRASELTAMQVGKLRADGLHLVGGVPGLGLQVTGAGAARSWLLRFVFNGRRPEMGLGPFPEVSLADARQAAREARALVRQGVNPIDASAAARSASAASRAAAKTFAECAEAFIAAKAPEWSNAKHAYQWTATLTTYAFPTMGSLLVRDVDTPHVLATLEPIWLTKMETATRVRARIENVLDWAAARGYRSGPNPARWKGHLAVMLARPGRAQRVEHHAALPYAELPAFMARLRTAEGQGARALELVILAAARSGEVRGARWSEIDGATWVVPAERMKAGREHRVPLSTAARSLLQRQAHEGELIFSSARGTTLSDMTLVAVVRRMGIDAVPHGFRATFKTWASEQTSFPNEVIEMALAHTIGNKTEEAYQRGELLDKRRRLMQAWADYCSSTPARAAVTPIRKDRAARTAA